MRQWCSVTYHFLAALGAILHHPKVAGLPPLVHAPHSHAHHAAAAAPVVEGVEAALAPHGRPAAAAVDARHFALHLGAVHLPGVTGVGALGRRQRRRRASLAVKSPAFDVTESQEASSFIRSRMELEVFRVEEVCRVGPQDSGFNTEKGEKLSKKCCLVSLSFQ